MCNWRAWLIPGLLTLFIVTALAVMVRSGAIEADLTERSGALLVEDGTPWVSLSLSGRDATLSGTAPTQVARDAAIAAAHRVWGIHGLDHTGLTLLPLADPYTLQFSRSADSVTVSGAFPNGEIRAEVLDAVREGSGDLPLIDETELARGAPLGFAQIADFAADGLSRISDGTIRITGNSLEIDAMALDQESYVLEIARLDEPTGVLEVESFLLRPPLVDPYVWEAMETEVGITLSGFLPDEETRVEIVAAAQSLGDADDQMLLGSGAPDGFGDAAVALLGQMGNLDNAAAAINMDLVTLNGEAPDSASFEAANAFLGTIPDGFGSISGTVLPPIAEPFTTTLIKASAGYTLSGVLPDEVARAVLLDALVGQGLSVADETTIARGASEDYEIAVVLTAVATVIGTLTDGTATLTNDRLSVVGAAPSFQEAGAAEANLRSIETTGLSLDVTIEAGPVSPFTFAASTQGPSVELDGFVPSEAKRETVLADVAALFPGRALAESLQVADGAPEGFDALVNAGLRGLGRLEGGVFSISDGNARLVGDAYYESSVSRIERDLTDAVPASAALTTELGILPPPTLVDDAQCQSLFAELLADNTIRFESGSADIDTLSFGLIDRLIRTLQSCPEARVEIAGHTDSEGSDELNQSLSEDRANAVLEYVLAAEVDATRISAQGYGEADPIADNATEEGRARNRRIEFNVLRQPEQ